MNKFPEAYHFSRLNQEEVENLNEVIFNNESNIKNPPTNKSPVPD